MDTINWILRKFSEADETVCLDSKGKTTFCNLFQKSYILIKKKREREILS